MSILRSLIQTTEEIFSNYISLSATSGEPGSAEIITDDGQNITSVIHFSGSHQGFLAVRFPLQTAQTVSSSLLYLEEEDLSESDLNDAIGEISNILAGRVKAAIDPSGKTIQLSLPEICSLEILKTLGSGGKNIFIPFYMDDGNFYVTLQYQ